MHALRHLRELGAEVISGDLLDFDLAWWAKQAGAQAVVNMSHVSAQREAKESPPAEAEPDIPGYMPCRTRATRNCQTASKTSFRHTRKTSFGRRSTMHGANTAVRKVAPFVLPGPR